MAQPRFQYLKCQVQNGILVITITAAEIHSEGMTEDLRLELLASVDSQENPKVVLGVDVLAPEGYGEIIGGGQRIHDPELLLKRIQEHNLPPEAFNWYLDLLRYGSVPHAGFGMGLERFVAWMCGLEHIRETIAFPRMLYRTRP